MRPKDGHRQHRSRGKMTGIGICSFLCSLFRINEILPEEQKLTDNDIANKLEKEYPNRKSAFAFRGPNKKTTINNYRNRYNNGHFNSGLMPTVFSFRYNERGQRVDGRTGKVPLTSIQVKEMVENHARQSVESIRERSV